MKEPTIRLKTLRQMARCDPEPFCPSPAYTSDTKLLVDELKAKPAHMRCGFYLTELGWKELTRLEAIWAATRRRVA